MRCPSDAQARLLGAIDDTSDIVEFGADTKDSWANLVVERVDRERNVSRFESLDGGYYSRRHRRVTVQSCLRAGWLSDLHERTLSLPPSAWHPRARVWRLKQLDMTEDGVIALGLWRERKLQSPPPEAPRLSDRGQEIVELAQRALELGYTLCPRKPARSEARALRRAGWFTPGGCWVANSASGLVPSPMAVVQVRPASADVATDNGDFFDPVRTAGERSATGDGDPEH